MSTSPKPLGWQSSATFPDLKNKIVLITGIGQQGDQSMWGNGAATARVFAAQGARIYGCDLKLEAAEHTAERLRKEFEGLEIRVQAADVTKEDEVEQLVKNCFDWHQRIDVLINNVGKSEPGDATSMTPATWNAQLSVNLTSVYLTCHFVAPYMSSSPTGGSIVNLSSVAGMRYIGKPQIAYAASKAGVVQFTKASGVMYAQRGIRMNVVVPGLMHTPLVGVLADKYAGGDLEGFVEGRNRAVPMGMMGDAFDVANAVVWLASEQSRYVTGQKIVVDGGITGSTG